MNKELSLIDGQFTPKDALELLISLYSSKIQFHQMKNFSSMERYGIEDEIAMKRIPRLRESIDTITKMMKEAESNSEMIEIRSAININFSNNIKTVIQ